MKRRVIWWLMVMVISFSTVTPAWASDHEELISRSTQAEYTGEEVIACNTPDGVRDAVVDLRQKDGVVYVSSSAGGATVAAGAGQLSVSGPEGAITSVGVESTGAAVVSRYQVSPAEETAYLERLADQVTLGREGVTRVRMVFDRETGALLRTETFNKNGTVYCSARLISFSPGEPQVAGFVVNPEDVSKLPPTDRFERSLFPEDVLGFQRVDVYVWNEVGELAYYSDGFFAFVLYHSPRAVQLSSSSGARKVALDLGDYQRVFTPGRVVYVWETTKGGMALVGDLPLDMQEEVLGQLAAPGKPGLFTRIIRKIFPPAPVSLSQKPAAS
jgi:hypothetical protein